MDRYDSEQPTILVMFGISGDLSRRYSLPALVEIKKARLLPKNFKLVGVSRRDISKNDILKRGLKTLAPQLEILQMDLDDPEDYHKLKQYLEKSSQSFDKPPQIIFYLVVPPEGVNSIVANLGQAKLNRRKMKLMLEKPFGSDWESAKSLIKLTKRYFNENQLYYIDHYLAKEVVQNISVFLGSNALFRSIWSNKFIEKIEIIASEKLGVDDRTLFYEQTGALRDLIQSHLLQLAALVLTEPSADVFDIERLPPGRLVALKSIRPPNKNELSQVTAAQYNGYAKSAGGDSNTETFVDLKLHSNDSRWKGVPLELTTGKKLSEKLTEVNVYFKKTHDSQSNLLVFRIQPRESIELELWVKEPGLNRRIRRVSHGFDYGYHFGRLPNAYEQVLVDVLRGSHGLFATSAEVLASWKIIQPILNFWAAGNKRLKIYKPGSTIDKVLSI